MAVAAGLIAVLAPILGGYVKIPGLSAWTAWATTAAAAFAGYIFAGRMEYLRTSYTATAWRLGSVHAHWDTSDNDKSPDGFQHLGREHGGRDLRGECFLDGRVRGWRDTS